MKRGLAGVLAFTACLVLTGCSLISSDPSPGPYSVSGRVERFYDQEPVPGATLAFTDAKGGSLGIATTDTLGRWDKSGLRGEVSIRVAQDDYALHPNQFKVTRAGHWTIKGHPMTGPSLIAFAVEIPGRSVNEIGIVHTDGSGYRVLSDEPCYDPIVSWSPDGKRLACSMLVGTSGTDEICVIDVDSGDVERFTTNACVDTRPAWSADGKMIAYESTRDNARWIYIADVSTKVERQLCRFPDGIFGPMRWMPNNDGLAAGDYSGLVFSINSDSGATFTQVTGLSRIQSKFDISLDFRKVVFERGFGTFYGPPIDICIFDIETGSEQRLTRQWETGDGSRWPSFSPDGKQIVFVRANDLWVMNADGAGAHPILEGIGRITYPVWSPIVVQ